MPNSPDGRPVLAEGSVKAPGGGVDFAALDTGEALALVLCAEEIRPRGARRGASIRLDTAATRALADALAVAATAMDRAPKGGDGHVRQAQA